MNKTLKVNFAPQNYQDGNCDLIEHEAHGPHRCNIGVVALKIGNGQNDFKDKQLLY